jgi:GH18 family chitinase
VRKPIVQKPEEKKEEPETKIEGQERAGKVLVCYLGSWSNYRLGEGKFVMEDINPNLCTHIVYGFAKLENNKITPFDSWLDLEEEWGLGLSLLLALNFFNLCVKTF